MASARGDSCEETKGCSGSRLRRPGRVPHVGEIAKREKNGSEDPPLQRSGVRINVWMGRHGKHVKVEWSKVERGAKRGHRAGDGAHSGEMVWDALRGRAG